MDSTRHSLPFASSSARGGGNDDDDEGEEEGPAFSATLGSETVSSL